MRTYIKKLSLRNFQSHRETDLEFSPGLNIIVGPSDQGKSAIIRALRWLFYNEPRGTGFIRVGETR
jgi:exonuclease SbcC